MKVLILFRIGLFRDDHRWEERVGSKKRPPSLLPKICRTCPAILAIIKLGTVIPDPKKIQKNI